MRKIFAVLLSVLLLFSYATAENVIKYPYELSFQDYTLTGEYTGELGTEALPDGYGVFETSTPDGIACHYIGMWKDGLMNGEGATYWADGSLEFGEYRDGFFIIGKYNYNGLKLLTASADGEETLNPHLRSLTTRSVQADGEAQTVMYIGNRNSKVFHRLECDSVRTMKEKNKIEFYSREEAEEKHYKPCSVCMP